MNKQFYLILLCCVLILSFSQLGLAENNNITLDCTKAKKILNWKPKYKLDLGIKKTLDWYKKNYIKINSINN